MASSSTPFYILYPCKYEGCRYSAPKLVELYVHALNNHTNAPGSFWCPICARTYKSSWRKHVRQSKPHKLILKETLNCIVISTVTPSPDLALETTLHLLQLSERELDSYYDPEAGLDSAGLPSLGDALDGIDMSDSDVPYDTSDEEADDDTLLTPTSSAGRDPVAAAEALLLQCINPTLLFPTLFAATTTTSFPPTVSDSPPAVGYDSDEELDGDPSAPHPTDFHNTHGNDLYTALNTTQKGLFALIRELRLSLHKFCKLCHFLTSPMCQKEDLPLDPSAFWRKCAKWSKVSDAFHVAEGTSSSVALRYAGPLNVPLIHLFEAPDKSHGCVVDPVVSIRNFMAVPCLSEHVYNVVPQLPVNCIRQFAETSQAHTNPFFANCLLQNRHGRFHLGSLVVYKNDCGDHCFGILNGIAQHPANKKIITCSITICLSADSASFPRWADTTKTGNTQQLWPTDVLNENIPFDDVTVMCSLYTQHDYTALLSHGPLDFFASCSLLLSRQQYDTYFPWVKKVPLLANPKNLMVMHTPIKLYLDGAGVWHCVQLSYTLGYYMFETVPVELQLQPQYMRLLGIWSDAFSNLDIGSHTVHCFELLLKGVEVYHAHLNKDVLLVPVLTLVLCDQMQANPLCAVKCPTGNQGNRHYHYPAKDYSTPINADNKRNDIRDEHKRLTIANSAISKSAKSDFLKKHGLTKKTSPFFQFCRYMLLFPNCKMHVLEINTLPRFITLGLKLLSKRGLKALKAVAHSDLFVDVHGNNNTLSRLRFFGTNLDSCVAHDVRMIMFSLIFVFRIVFHSCYMKRRTLQCFATLATDDFMGLRLLYHDLSIVYWYNMQSQYSVDKAVLLTMSDLEKSVRQRFTAFFGEQIDIPSHLNFDILALPNEVTFYGPSRITAEGGEHMHHIPKDLAQFTNRRDIAPQLAQDILIIQCLQEAALGAVYRSTDGIALLYPEIVAFQQNSQAPSFGLHVDFSFRGDVTTDWLSDNRVPRFCFGDYVCWGFNRVDRHHLRKLEMITSLREAVQRNLFYLPPPGSLYLQVKRVNHPSYHSKYLQAGQSVTLVDGTLVHIKYLFVIRVHSANHVWLHGTKWSLTNQVVDGFSFPVLQLTSLEVDVPCSSIQSGFLTAHCCNITSSKRAHLLSLQTSEANLPPLCLLCPHLKHRSAGVIHNPRNTFYFKRPCWL